MPSIPPGDSGDAIGNEEPTDVNRMAVPWNRRSSDGLETLGSESGASSLGTAWFESGTYELKPGMTLGEYRIEGKIGQGGMGVVFGAIHPTIGKRAAIKVLKKELCKDPLQLERFVSEARVVNEINHPNIVDIFAFSEMPDGRWYFVMEWLKGETLYQRIHRAPFTFADLVMVVRPVCRALEAAHGKGITHRDLKPENIFLVEVPNEKQPHIKLLDFGLAKLQRTYERNHNTAVGTIIGTPQYMAPEQAAGGEIDHRVDVYALGGIMFELMTGRPPFQADNAIELVAKHVIEAPIRPSSLIPEIPTVIDELIVKMLAKSPDERPALSEVIRVIERVRMRPGSAMMITTVRPAIPVATPPSDSMSEEEPTTQANEDFSQLMQAQGSLSDQIVPTLSEQLVPTLSEQLAMPVARPNSLESNDEASVGRPSSDSMELGPPGAPRPVAGSLASLELGPPGVAIPAPPRESPPPNAPRPTLQGTAVPTPPPQPVAIPHPISSAASGPIKAIKPTSAGSSGQLKVAEIAPPRLAEAAPPIRVAESAPPTLPTPPPTKLPRATTGPPTINLPSDDAIRAAIGEALDAAGAVGADDPTLQSGDNFVIRIKNRSPGATGEMPSLPSQQERPSSGNLLAGLSSGLTGVHDRAASPIPTGTIASQSAFATQSGVERRRAESPRELIQPKATSTVIKRQRSVLPWFFVIALLVAGAAVTLALFVF